MTRMDMIQLGRGYIGIILISIIGMMPGGIVK